MNTTNPMDIAITINSRDWLIACAAFSMLFFGCGERNARSLSVNEPAARKALDTFLSAWKEGKKCADLKPKIIGKDSDWESQSILVSYEVQPKERSDGANLFFTVHRTIKTTSGEELEQDVGYVVGTSPAVTVFRSDE